VHGKELRNNYLPGSKAKQSFRRISGKVLKRLVAAVGLEPTTYGL
jgi:hypothetical protein